MSLRWPANTTPSARACSITAGSTASALSLSAGPTITNLASEPVRRSVCAASNSSTMPFSRTSLPTTPHTTSPSPMPHSARNRSRVPGGTASGLNRCRSMPLPSRCTLRAGTCSTSTSVSTSSGFCTSSAWLKAAAMRSAAYTGQRRRRRSVGCAYSPCWVFTTSGTRSSRPAMRPSMPGFGLCVCTMSGRSRRSSTSSCQNARTSCNGFVLRVNAGTATWRMPIAVRFATCGPAADMPTTS